MLFRRVPARARRAAALIAMLAAVPGLSGAGAQEPDAATLAAGPAEARAPLPRPAVAAMSPMLDRIGEAGAAMDAPSCMRVIWNPPTSEICGAKWSVQAAAKSVERTERDRRYSCVPAPDGGALLAITSWGDRPNSLLDLTPKVEGGADAARLTGQMFIPKDYRPFDGGRIAFGILIGERKCSSGGCLPSEQTGAQIRANFRVSKDKRSIQLANYSYHLDRRTKARETDSQWAGGKKKVRAYGAGTRMDRALPKGEWITLRLDVGLNTPGRADGFSTLSAFDARGDLIGAASYRDVTYRPDASWKITGPAFTDKYNKAGTGPKDQTIYYRNFRLETGERAACGW